VPGGEDWRYWLDGDETHASIADYKSQPLQLLVQTAMGKYHRLMATTEDFRAFRPSE
jgi:hypothetical protein